MNLKIVSLFVVSLHGTYAANLFLNSGFESPVISPGSIMQLGTGSSTLTNWIVTGANCGSNCILIISNTYTENANVGTLNFGAHGGAQSLDLTGAGNTLDGGIRQTVTLTPTLNYTINFWVGNMDNRATSYPNASSVQVLVNGNSLGTFSNSNNTNNQTNWLLQSVSFTATTATNNIEFRNATPQGDNLAGLDDVSIDVTSAVPEPGTFALMGMVLAGFSLAVRARRKS